MEFLILSLLQEPLTFRQLEDLCGFDRDRLNAFIKYLLKRGYITRTGIRRKYLYHITTKGLVKLYIWKLKRLLGGI